MLCRASSLRVLRTIFSLAFLRHIVLIVSVIHKMPYLGYRYLCGLPHYHPPLCRIDPSLKPGYPQGKRYQAVSENVVQCGSARSQRCLPPLTNSLHQQFVSFSIDPPKWRSHLQKMRSTLQTGIENSILPFSPLLRHSISHVPSHLSRQTSLS